MKFAFMSRILDYDGYGIQTSLAGLLRGISQIGTGHEIFLFTDPGQDLPQFIKTDVFNIVTVQPQTSGMAGKFWWDHVSVGRACKRLNIDALYAPTHVRPLFVPCPVVVVVHDMLYHLFPNEWSVSDRIYFRTAVTMLTPKADAVIAVSKNTQDDMLKILPLTEDKIEVIHHGVPEGFTPKEHGAVQIIREKYKLRKPFVLYAGSFHPRKNLVGVINAFEAIADEFPHELVIVGKPIWQNLDIESKISESAFADRIRWIGFVPRDELPLFFNAAEVFLFPSKYEGFGLPVLEAMACGCPTITSNVSSLPEVAGNAAVLVQPEDEDAIANALRRLLRDGAYRESLSQQSLEKAKEFSWEKAARETITLLERIAR